MNQTKGETMRLVRAFLAVLCLAGAVQAQAETVNRNAFACGSESTLKEVVRYSEKNDEAGVLQLLNAGLCTILRKGEAVSVIEPGFLTATVRYKGARLFTQADAVR